MTAYKIEITEAGYRNYGTDRIADNQARATVATGWRPAAVCGLGLFDTEATADMVARDAILNYAPLRYEGVVHPDKLVLRVVPVESAESGATADDYRRARREWIASDGGIAKLPAVAVELSPLEFDMIRSRGIEDRG